MRVEFEGAFHHVMARGDRREAIVGEDADHEIFVRTLGEANERSGFRVHGFVLVTNHYHLLLETPQANFSRGMGWLQNAFLATHEHRQSTLYRHRPIRQTA